MAKPRILAMRGLSDVVSRSKQNRSCLLRLVVSFVRAAVESTRMYLVLISLRDFSSAWTLSFVSVVVVWPLPEL